MLKNWSLPAWDPLVVNSTAEGHRQQKQDFWGDEKSLAEGSKAARLMRE